ncbi:MAG: hypothetical protein JW809_07935 [Pirellulales bacterium]|nr:hypothetical protein [Pirellulales bacterium]
MAQTYAGILGLLAMLTAMARGALHHGGDESLMWSAWCGLWVFAGIGYVVGRMGDWIVRESVQARIAVEIAAEEERDAQAAAKAAAAPAG